MSRPKGDHRMAVYRALKAAYPCAVGVSALWSEGLTNVHAHIESLRFEGHGITQVQIGDKKQEWGFRLDLDAWAATHAIPPLVGQGEPSG